MTEFSYVIRDEAGIHARPAGELVKLAKKKCNIFVPAKKTVTKVVLSSQMYINNKGKLVVILPEKSQAGAEFYYHKYTF